MIRFTTKGITEPPIGMNAFSKNVKVGKYKLYQFLRDQNILDENNKPLSEFEDCFKIVLKERQSTYTKDEVLLVTEKGQGIIRSLVGEKYIDVPLRTK